MLLDIVHTADETRGTGSPRTATGERSSRNREIDANWLLDRVLYRILQPVDLLLENLISKSSGPTECALLDLTRSTSLQAWHTGFAALTGPHFGAMGVGNTDGALPLIPVSLANPWRALFVPFSL
jgi:hypothetical protein